MDDYMKDFYDFSKSERGAVIKKHPTFARQYIDFMKGKECAYAVTLISYLETVLSNAERELSILRQENEDLMLALDKLINKWTTTTLSRS